MKKKWSAAMILVMVLISIAAIAVASVVLKEYYEKAFSTQNEEGYYQQWALTDKIALIDRMVKNDFDIDHEMVAKLSDTTLSENEKNALADAIVIGYYGEGHDGALSVVNKPDGIEQPARIFRYARRWLAKAHLARCSLERKRSEHIYIVKLRKLIAEIGRASCRERV